MTSITKYGSPWGTFPSIFTPASIDRIFSEINDDWFTVKDTYPYNITQKKDKSGNIVSTIITFALAGVNKDNVNVKLEDGSLLVSVDKQEQVDTNDLETVYLHRGISARSTRTKFNLYNVDVENITSTLKDGLLEITLPSKIKTVKQIDIN